MLTGLLAVACATSACQLPPEACGEYPPEGGPALIKTRDQELCEITRQRVMQHLQRRQDLDLDKAETLFEASQRWQFADTIEDLLARIEKDGGPEMAEAVRRAVASVESSTKPFTTECEKQREKCMARGAAKGAYLALTQRGDLVRGLQPKTDAAPQGSRGGGIDIEDLAD
jgi:hypothetical protein